MKLEADKVSCWAAKGTRAAAGPVSQPAALLLSFSKASEAQGDLWSDWTHFHLSLSLSPQPQSPKLVR